MATEEDIRYYMENFDLNLLSNPNCAEDDEAESNVPSMYGEPVCTQLFGGCFLPSNQGYSPTEQLIAQVPGAQSYLDTKGQFMTPETSTQERHFEQQLFQTVPALRNECPWSQQNYGGSNTQQDWNKPTDLMPTQPTSFSQLYSPNVMTGQGPDGQRLFPAEALVFSGSGPIQSWQFLLRLLTDNPCQHLISWTGNGWEFKLSDPDEVARRWGIQKKQA